MTNVHKTNLPLPPLLIMDQFIPKQPILQKSSSHSQKRFKLSNPPNPQIQKNHSFLPPPQNKMSLLLLLLLLLLPAAAATSFSFPSFNSSNLQSITLQNDSFFDKVIKLTKNDLEGSITRSVGRAVYRDPIRIHDPATGDLADLSTRFSFVINALNTTCYGDGLAFFLAPSPSASPPNSSGRGLGLVDDDTAPDAATRFVAVEFDTFMNGWDPSQDHVGIDIGSVRSAATANWPASLKNGEVGTAWVTYNASTRNLSVFLTYDEDPVFAPRPTLSCAVDLREVLPEFVEVGFSASTGGCVETHNVLSWEFRSSMGVGEGRRGGGIGLGVGLSLGVVGVGFMLVVGGFGWFFAWRRRRIGEEEGEEWSFDDELERGRGPRRFGYGELEAATGGFDEGVKVGEGGFGGVYRGVLKGGCGDVVAVKRVGRGSKQGKKEYVAEIRIIGRLRHRNLVQLVGWCHGRGELMLVYEFLANGSLDAYLYDGGRFLAWHFR